MPLARWLSLALVVVCVGLVASAARAESDPLARLRLLVGGVWEAHTASGKTIRVSYRLVAKGSVLVQTFTPPSGDETLTVFHADGARLLATHYCAQGNQPRLQLSELGSPERLVFRYLDATNLAAPAAAHLVRLELQLDGPDAYTEIETCEEAGKPDVTPVAAARMQRNVRLMRAAAPGSLGTLCTY